MGLDGLPSGAASGLAVAALEFFSCRSFRVLRTESIFGPIFGHFLTEKVAPDPHFSAFWLADFCELPYHHAATAAASAEISHFFEIWFPTK